MSLQVLISEGEIQEKIQAMADQMSRDYSDVKSPLLMVGILKGSFIFLADLSRKLSVPTQVDFMEVSSYGASTETSGDVRVLKDLRSNIKDRDVILVEDIVDTGLTLNRVLDFLKSKQPRSLKVCSLLYKPSRERVKIDISYLGFKIEDHFVVGYGMDYAEDFRNLPYVGIYSERND